MHFQTRACTILWTNYLQNLRYERRWSSKSFAQNARSNWTKLPTFSLFYSVTFPPPSFLIFTWISFPLYTIWALRWKRRRFNIRRVISLRNIVNINTWLRSGPENVSLIIMGGMWYTRKFNDIDLLDCNDAERLSSVSGQAYFFFFYEICLLLRERRMLINVISRDVPQ